MKQREATKGIVKVKKLPEFKYIDDMTETEKEEAKDSTKCKLLYIDPGKRDLLTIMDDDGVRLKFSHKQLMFETNVHKYNYRRNIFLGKPIKNYKKKKGKKKWNKN